MQRGDIGAGPMNSAVIHVTLIRARLSWDIEIRDDERKQNREGKL